MRENHRRNQSQRASGENNQVKQQGYEDRTRRSPKIWSNADRRQKSNANSRQKSKANSSQDKSTANGRQDKSIANGRQSKPKDHDRDKAKYEEKHTTEESCSQLVPKHPRTDADVRQERYELKLGEVITTIPKIDFDEEIVEYKKIIQTAQKQRLGMSRHVRSEIVNTATHSHSLKQMYDEVAERSTNLDAQSAQQLKTAATSRILFFRNQEGSRTEHYRHSCSSATTGACDSEATENGGYPHCLCTLTRPSMSQLRSNAEKTPQKQHEDCMTEYNEIKMDKKMRSA